MKKRMILAITALCFVAGVTGIVQQACAAGEKAPGLIGIQYGDEDFEDAEDIVKLSGLDQSWGQGDGFGKQWAGKWQGFIIGPATGDVKLTLETDQEAKVEIAGKVVLNSKRGLTAGSMKMVKDKKYPIVLTYVKQGSEYDCALKVQWSWEGRASSVVGGESLVHSADTMAELKAMVDAADGDDDNDGAGARVPPAANWAITIPSKARAYLDQAIIGPQNVTVALVNYAQVRYVSQETGSDSSGNGSRTNPWATIDYALSQITDAGPSNSCALLVAKGTYAGATIEMKEYVDMYGGYSASGWDRDIFANKSILDGQLARRVMVAADNCTLDGFVITRGRVGGGRGLDIHYNYDHTGCGAGIAIVGVSPVISNCVFTDNMTTRPVPWNPKPIKKDYDDGWHQTANDGGAISIFDHAYPVIANNIFYDNRTEVGRGAAVSSNYYCNPVIANNVMFNNIASTNDPMRSGDGGAINAYEYGYVVIQNNIVANNKAESRGDGGGFAVHWWVSALVKDNVVVNNVGRDDGGGIFMAGQKHHWEPDEPQPPYPEYKIYLDGNVLMGNEADNSESDPVRFTKLVVAEFTNNVIVDHSEGLYFQNSTVDLFNNTIGGKARIENDRPYKSNPRCNAYNNIFLDHSVGSGSNNYVGDSGLVKDGFRVSGSATFDSARYLTTVVVSGANYTPGALKKRVVVSGRTWSAIKDNTSDTILVWGDVGGSFEVRNSYHISSNAVRAIDKGTNSVAPDHDMDGQNRPDSSGTVDIGADEYWENRIGPVIR